MNQQQKTYIKKRLEEHRDKLINECSIEKFSPPIEDVSTMLLPKEIKVANMLSYGTGYYKSGEVSIPRHIAQLVDELNMTIRNLSNEIEAINEARRTKQRMAHRRREEIIAAIRTDFARRVDDVMVGDSAAALEALKSLPNLGFYI